MAAPITPNRRRWRRPWRRSNRSGHPAHTKRSHGRGHVSCAASPTLSVRPASARRSPASPRFFTSALAQPPPNYRDILATDRAGYVRLTTALLARGVRALERGAWFISVRHDDADI